MYERLPQRVRQVGRQVVEAQGWVLLLLRVAFCETIGDSLVSLGRYP